MSSRAGSGERAAVDAGFASGVAAHLGRLRWGTQLVIVLSLVAVVARVPGLVRTGLFDGDEATLAVMGRVMAGGGRLYVDVIDRKPPIVVALFALANSTGIDLRGIRFLCAVGILANGVIVALLVRRLTEHSSQSQSQRAAIAGGALSVLGTALFLPGDAQAANFELWGLFPASAAVLAAVMARRTTRPVWLWFALAGALVAIAANCKQPYIVVLVPVGIEAVRASGGVRNVVAVLGGLVVASLPLAFLVDLGTMLRWSWIENGDYINGGLSLWRALGVGVASTVLFLALHLPLLVGLWAAITRRIRIDVTLAAWGLVSLLVVAIGLRFFGHYYEQLVPPLAVLSGVALASAGRRVWRLEGVLAVGATLALVGLAFIVGPPVSNFHEIGSYIRSTTTPSDRILVWGSLPDVYLAADREPTGVFLHDGYLTGNWASRETPLPPSAIDGEPYRNRWATFMGSLDADPPELIVDASGASLDWDAYPVSAYPLESLIDRCYNPEGRIADLPVWRRDWSACPARMN